MTDQVRCSGGGKLVRWRWEWTKLPTRKRQGEGSMVPHCSWCGQVVEVAKNGGAKSHTRPKAQWELEDEAREAARKAKKNMTRVTEPVKG